MTSAPTFDEAASSLRQRAARAAEAFSRGQQSDHWIDELSWTAGQLGAHMVSVPRIYRSVLEQPDSFVIPESMATFGEVELAAVGTVDLNELGELLIAGVEALINTLETAPDVVPFYTTNMSRPGVLGIALNELSMHHRDFAVAVGEPFSMSDRDVAITMHGMMPASEVFNDCRIAQKCSGTYHVGLRGGDDWTIHVADGRVCVSIGRPKHADVRIVGSPQAMVLTSFGRLHPVRAFITGQVFVCGRRPWKLWWFQQLFVEELSLNADAIGVSVGPTEGLPATDVR